MQNCDHHNKCTKKAIKAADQYCNTRGLRFTSIRKKVLEIIWETHNPIKAYDILDKLKGIGAEKPPTVYRALNFLLDNRLIHKLSSQQSYIGCEHANAHDQCYFLSCTECGDITECCSNELDNAFSKVVTKAKFNQSNVVCEISGICSICS